MKRTLRTLLWLSIMAALAGCQSRAVPTTRWSWSVSPGQPQAPLPEQLRVEAPGSLVVKWGEEQIRSSPLRIGSALVEGSWTRNVLDRRGQVVYADGRIYDGLSAKLRTRTERAQGNRDAVRSRIAKQLPMYAASSWSRGPELTVERRPRLPGWNLRWVVHFLDRAEDRFKKVTTDSRGEILSVLNVGSDYRDAPALVFPRGPKASLLSDVILNGLVGDVGLANARVRVSSVDAPDALQWEPVTYFKYGLSDHRFDAVQAYFYADRALSWFKERTGFELPEPLTLDVFAGGLNQPRNTACYYFGQVRIGLGDGVLYRDLMRDPSVVTHEVAHAVIEQVSHLSTEGEGGSLNEAFADFFAASILENSKMGEVSYVEGPFRRDIDNTAALSGRNGGLYHDSMIVSGTLWALRQSLGSTLGHAIAFKTLARLNADSNLADFKAQLALVLSDGLGPEESRKAQTIASARGWN